MDKSDSVKQGPIEVYEETGAYLVHIHPEDRGRAKAIRGRQWDGDRKAWVYEKNDRMYEALVSEFKDDADKFTITPPGDKDEKESIEEPAVEHEDEDLRGHDDSEAGHGEIREELIQISEVLGQVKDNISNQNRAIDEFTSKQNDLKTSLDFMSVNQDSDKAVEQEPVLPDVLNMALHMRLLEKTICSIAVETSGNDEGFADWISKYQPLARPNEFTCTTNEFIRKQMIEVVHATATYTFYELIRRASEENAYYDANRKVRVIPVLHDMNNIRNQFAHSEIGMNQSESLAKACIYLFKLALVWKKIVIDV